MESALTRLEADARAFANTGALLTFVLETINAARLRGATTGARAAGPFKNLNTFTALRDATQKYGDRVFAWHQRRTSLRAAYRADIAVHDDYSVWVMLVQETMLGDMDESARRDEFALQAAYVVFIRLLLLRVCEDKGIFRHRFVSDGGLKHWREDIDRYLQFADGDSVYDPLLDMAYLNAKNIYAHFFTGWELFNWYKLERPLLLLALHQLSRFDFAQVHSDILGTIYGTYVDRKEKKKKGQYYTPPAIVRYILDEVGYREENGIASPNRRLIDPACGSGTFLVEAAQRLVAAYRKAGEQTHDPLEVLKRVRNNLVGFDLNPFACYLAEVNLLIQTLDLVKDACDATGKPPRLEPFHIYNVDALARPDHTYYGATFSTLLADELQEVDAIKSRAPETPYANGFAFVVANPPYGAKLTDDYKARLTQDYSDVFSGRVDSYRLLTLTILDAPLRRYLAGYLSRPQWQGQTWDGLKSAVHILDGDAALAAFFALEAERIAYIDSLVEEAARLDAAIDVRILDLYGIMDAADRDRILGSAPVQEDEEISSKDSDAEPELLIDHV